MGMVITMVLINKLETKHIIKKMIYSTTLLLLMGQYANAETKVQPKVSANTYAYWYQNEQVSQGTDRGLALLLTPEITISRNRPNVKSSLFWQQEAVWYHDAQRSQQSAQTYRAENVITAFNQHVSWGVNARGGYRIRDSRQGIYSDIVTSSENLTKTKSYGTHLSFTTSSGATTQAKLSLGYDALTADGTFSGEDEGYSNKSYRGGLNLGRARRSDTFFWNLTGNYNQVDREVFNDFESSRANAIAGVPIWNGLSFILRSSYEQNQGSANFDNEFFSYGAGLELKLGRVSWVNVTWNKSRITRATEDMLDSSTRDDDYLAASLYLAPSRRTSLSFSLDKRYFGRTMSLQGNYNLRFLSIRLVGTDSVRTESQLTQEFESLGIFVCPDGSTSLIDCFRPPSSTYIPKVGESFQLFGIFHPQLSERIVLSRSVLLGVGYSKNKLSLNITASTGEDEYVEIDRFTRRHSLTMQALWQVYANLTANVDLSFYRFNYIESNRDDNNMSATFGLNYLYTPKLEFTADIRHVRRDSSLANADISETRLGLGVSYAF
jgi:uncharacterized protein (PEP-CTERM system associated)